MCQTVAALLTTAALGAVESSPKPAAGQIYTVAEAAREIDTLLEEMSNIPMNDAAAASSTLNSLVSLLDTMRQKSVMLYGERKSRYEAISAQLELAARSWTQAGSIEARREPLAQVRKSWAALKKQFPPEALQILPRLWSCPMHGEVLEKSAGVCPICGMSLDPIYVTQPQLTSDPIIQAAIITSGPLQVGTKADFRIHLTFTDSKAPVALADLEETHTRRIHLLITEPTETDYHHEHPEPLGNGDYSFSFTPARPGIYRVWADLKPVRTHVQQFSIADIPASAKAGQLQPDEPENRQATVEGYKFDLSFATPVVQAKDTVAGTLHVTDPSGRPCDALEVVMGAFGHLVGFSDDFSTVLHMHPVGRPPATAESHGGPELPFYFRSNKSGLVRLFAQVKIGGKDFFPRFVIRVQSPQHLPGS